MLVILLQEDAIRSVRFRELHLNAAKLNIMNPMNLGASGDVHNLAGRALDTATPNESFIEQFLGAYSNSYADASEPICLLKYFERDILRVSRDQCFDNIEELHQF